MQSRPEARQARTRGRTVAPLDALASRISAQGAAWALNHARRPRVQTIAATNRKQA